jgi:hypothetical protein
MLGLEALHIGLQPFIDVGNTQVNETSQVILKVRDPFRVVDMLPGSKSIPRVTQNCQMMLTIGSWPCEQESGVSVFRFDGEVRVETLTSSV